MYKERQYVWLRIGSEYFYFFGDITETRSKSFVAAHSDAIKINGFEVSIVSDVVWWNSVPPAHPEVKIDVERVGRIVIRRIFDCIFTGSAK
jgi:hypothetical protein